MLLSVLSLVALFPPALVGLDEMSCFYCWRASRLLWWTLLLPLLVLLSFLANVSSSGAIVVVENPIFDNDYVSRFGVVVGQGEGLGAHDFT